MFFRAEVDKKGIYSGSGECLIGETLKPLIILVKLYRYLTSDFFFLN